MDRNRVRIQHRCHMFNIDLHRLHYVPTEEESFVFDFLNAEEKRKLHNQTKQDIF